MTNLMHMRLKKTDYTDLVHRLNLLYAFQNEDPAVKSLLQKFVPIGKTLSLSTPTIRTLDADGRSYTIGSRKTARAQCWIVPGNGQVYVNGIRLPEYFRDMVNREVIVKPFEVANCLMKYNTWAIVSGGGHSGQAQAVAVAVARGIAIHDSTKENLFKKLGMLMIDTRQVERKKTGQPGARKKNTWVRR
ncbi:ribosomal protein S9/S16 [Batrachochytrium dendrobatidis JEL423]|uniref:Small ribosomal subunit protein uS9m n=2 Tax=Batrachochytrium dendrobatidis TaxID=109871 RepID=A0A177WA43_BATDL|nr:ribosomal protein S9/S16 [Batrachochytrium dendrobatidis JEL423]